MLQDKKSADDLVQNRVYLEVGGFRYEGWKNVSITHSIEHLSGTYNVEVFDKWDGQSEGWEIQAGDSCTVKIGSDVVITGYVDLNSASFDESSHKINVQGRDKAGDLVDCSAQPKEWTNQAFEFIVTELVKPFGITVTSQLNSDETGYTTKSEKKPAKTGGKKIPRQSAKSDDTVHGVIQKMAEVQGVLVISDRKGGLLITRAGLAGRCNDSLVLGENLKSIDYTKDFSQVFSKITVKGQAHSATTKTAQKLSRKEGALAKGEVEREKSNGVVGRHRPLTITATEQVDSARATKQAQWEASVREANATKISATVQGWRESNGTLWEINKLVRLKCPWVREDQDFVISSVEYTIGDSGTETKMELALPAAYTPNPSVAKNQEAKRETRGAQSKKQIKR